MLWAFKNTFFICTIVQFSHENYEFNWKVLEIKNGLEFVLVEILFCYTEYVKITVKENVTAWYSSCSL